MTDVTTTSPEVRSKATVTPDQMSWDSRTRRMVTIYLPLALFVVVLLFPFYWMAVTSFKPNAELYDYKKFNPFLIGSPTLQHIKHLLFETAYPHWLMTTMIVAVCATTLSLFSSVLAAYAIQRLRFRGSQYIGLGIYLAYLVPPSILFIPLATTIYQLGLFDSPLALILTYPTFLVPFSTWLLIGYFKSIPYTPADPAPHHPAAGGAGPDQRRHLLLHPVVERIHLCAGFHPEQREEDRVGRHPHRTCVRRCLSMGRADGGLIAGLAAGGDFLLFLRRLLRLVAHRRRQGIDTHPT